MTVRLEESTVLVTGATGGIGRAIARAIHRRGAKVVLTARRVDMLDEIARELGDRVEVVGADLSNRPDVERLGDRAAVDVLIANAAVPAAGRLQTFAARELDRAIDVNVRAPMQLTLALLPHMLERRFGHVVDISSIGVQTGPPRFSAYVASKAAMDAWADIVATEVLGEGVTFTTVHMPLVRTPMIAPTRIYDAFPTDSPEEAADKVLHALIDRPKHVGTLLGTLGAVSGALTPRLKDAVMHVAYRVFPESAAAREGSEQERRDDDRTLDTGPLSRGAQAMARLLPGVHW
jgi:short-subunit dehydrogenase